MFCNGLYRWFYEGTQCGVQGEHVGLKHYYEAVNALHSPMPSHQSFVKSNTSCGLESELFHPHSLMMSRSTMFSCLRRCQILRLKTCSSPQHGSCSRNPQQAAGSKSRSSKHFTLKVGDAPQSKLFFFVAQVCLASFSFSSSLSLPKSAYIPRCP